MSDYFPCLSLPWPPEAPLVPAFPLKTRADIDGPRPYAIEVEWVTGEDGRPEPGPWAITGTGPPTTVMLRKEIPPILGLLHTGAELCTEDLDGSETEEQSAALLREASRRARRKAAGPGRPPLTDDYYRDVGRIYAQAKANRKRPVLAVAA